MANLPKKIVLFYFVIIIFFMLLVIFEGGREGMGVIRGGGCCGWMWLARNPCGAGVFLYTL